MTEYHVYVERKKDPIYTAAPAAKDYTAAQNYLGLLFPADVVKVLVAALRAAPVTQARANDILRAAHVPPLDEDDPGVSKEIDQIKDGEPNSPVLLVRGDLTHGIRLIIADGMHRTTAAFLRDPDAMVSCVMASIDWDQFYERTAP